MRRVDYGRPAVTTKAPALTEQQRSALAVALGHLSVRSDVPYVMHVAEELFAAFPQMGHLRPLLFPETVSQHVTPTTTEREDDR